MRDLIKGQGAHYFVSLDSQGRGPENWSNRVDGEPPGGKEGILGLFGYAKATQTYESRCCMTMLQQCASTLLAMDL